MQQPLVQQQRVRASGVTRRQQRLVVRATAAVDPSKAQDIRKEALARGPAQGSELFNAKFVPFKDVQSGSLSGEQYSLGEQEGLEGRARSAQKAAATVLLKGLVCTLWPSTGVSDAVSAP